MLDRLRSILGNQEARPPAGSPVPDDGDLRLAACVLFLELAWADSEYSSAERAHIEGVLHRHFGIQGDDARDLLMAAEAERTRSVDLWRFTNLVRENYSLGQKMVLAEAMWGLVYSDGTISDEEDYLIRKVSGLLGLEVGYLSQARKNWGRNGPSTDPS